MIRKTKYILTGVLAWLVITGQALAFGVSDDVKADDLIKEANRLFIEYKDSEALSKYQTVLRTEPSHYEALYKASLLNSRIGARYTDETEKLEYFSAAKGYAEMAVAANPNGADGHYVLALALNNLSIVTGVKDRLVKMREIRQHLDKALAEDPQHAGAWQLLGRWHYRAANLNFLECTASKFLTGGLPVGASNFNAIEALRKSIICNPKNISSYLDLAVIYTDMRKKADAVDILQQALKLNLITAEDLELSRRCKAMLAGMNPNQNS